jgi:hypothetical protein
VALSGNTFTNPVITGGSINNTPIGATTASTGKFSTLTNAALTSGRVTYAGTSGVLQDDADFTFNGTTVTMANDASISGLTVGKGAGAVVSNTVVGNGALTSNSTGSLNTIFGYLSGVSTTSSENTFVGGYAGNKVTSGTQNNAFGMGSLGLDSTSNVTGSRNIAMGYYALGKQTSGSDNVGIGHFALYSNTTGATNVAIGTQALVLNTTASNNTAVGYQAGYSNTTGANNTLLGYQAGYTGTTSGANIAFGYQAGFGNTTGNYNVALGHTALYTNTTGAYNVAVGYQSLYSANNVTGQNVGLGWATGYSVTTGTNNTFIGHSAGYYVTTGSKNSVLGNYSGNQVNLDIRTASNYSVISDGDGNRHLTSANGFSTALGNNSVPQSGTGITFPATQSASSDANTLDDYEEGDWTPVLSDGTNNATMETGTTQGKYTKIGKMVTVNFTVLTSSLGSVSGNITITGLPFVAGTGLAPQPVFSSGNQQLNVTAGQYVSGRIGATSSFVELWITNSTAGMTQMTATQWSSDGYANFSASYFTNT